MTWQAVAPLWFIPEGYEDGYGTEGPAVVPSVDLLVAKQMTSCPAYSGAGRCQSGCWTEPVCQVDEPTEGWPDTTGLIIVVPSRPLMTCGSCQGAGGDMSGLCSDCLGQGELPR